MLNTRYGRVDVNPEQTSPTNGEQTKVIVSATDRNFAFPATVALYSALAALDRSCSVYIYVISEGVTPAQQTRSSAVLHRAHPQVRVEWLAADAVRLADLPEGPWQGRATHLRFFIPELVPDRFGRILYIDADVVVTRDLSCLWSIDMNGHAVMAVQNFDPPTMGTAIPQLLDVIAAPPESPYFNAGVLLMDMHRWRQQRISERTVDFLLKNGARAGFANQDSLNAVLSGNWGLLDPTYNVQLLTLDRYGHSRGRVGEPHVAQQALLKDAAILHYTGRRKPWGLRYRGPAGASFLRAAARSGWFSPVVGEAWRTTRATAHFVYRGASAMKRALRATRTARVSVGDLVKAMSAQEMARCDSGQCGTRDRHQVG